MGGFGHVYDVDLEIAQKQIARCEWGAETNTDGSGASCYQLCTPPHVPFVVLHGGIILWRGVGVGYHETCISAVPLNFRTVSKLFVELFELFKFLSRVLVLINVIA